MQKASEKNFFEMQTPSSRTKAKIVAEYFPKYCRIILKRPQKEIRYIDLFAGPGKYEDGNYSTPLLLARACADDKVLCQKVHLMFNDNEHCEELRKNFRTCIGENCFVFAPKFGDKTVGQDAKITSYLTKEPQQPNPHPTLLFFDPFGYKTIDTLVLSKFLSNWGNEIFLFVNTKRINAAIDNGKFDELMRSLFPTTIDQLRKDKKYLAVRVYERLALIMDNLSYEFKKAVKGNLFCSVFKFQEEDSEGTSHFILHLTKHEKGFELVKQVYYDFDNIGAVLDKDGHYTFDAKRMDVPKGASIDFGDLNVTILMNQLLEKYKGRTISARALFDEHQPSTKWAGSHYLKTLRKMVDERVITATFTDEAEHTVTVLLTDHSILQF